MGEFLSQYQRIDLATWVYLSSLLTIGLFFKFSRFWSVRNLDLCLLLLLAPGMLLIESPLPKSPGTPPSTPVATSTTVPPSTSPPMSMVAPAPTASSTPSPPAADTTKTTTEEATSHEAADVPPNPKNPPSKTSAPTSPATVEDATTDHPTDKPQKTAAPDISQSLVGLKEKRLDTSSKSSASPKKDQKTVLNEREIARKRRGYLWLFGASTLLLVRLLFDLTMVRRPLLEPNLSIGGMTFIGCSLFVFLMANVLAGPTVQRGDTEHAEPGIRLIYELPIIPTSVITAESDKSPSNATATATAKTITILSHLAIVIGLVLIGQRHFDNIRMGVGAATLYLLLPYSAQMTGRVDHALPAALMVWAIVQYRRPMLAGLFLGLASIVYYPLYLLPLWFSFYWERGRMRFLTGILIALTLIIFGLIVTFGFNAELWVALKEMFGLWRPVMKGLGGIWNYYSPIYRLPLLVAFIALSVSFVLWPVQKNLGTLLGGSAAVMLATQFWMGHQGGLYMAWYLPMLLMTIYRPNLEDRVATSVLGTHWFPHRSDAALTRQEQIAPPH